MVKCTTVDIPDGNKQVEDDAEIKKTTKKAATAKKKPRGKSPAKEVTKKEVKKGSTTQEKKRKTGNVKADSEVTIDNIKPKLSTLEKAPSKSRTTSLSSSTATTRSLSPQKVSRPAPAPRVPGPVPKGVRKASVTVAKEAAGPPPATVKTDQEKFDELFEVGEEAHERPDNFCNPQLYSSWGLEVISEKGEGLSAKQLTKWLKNVNIVDGKKVRGKMVTIPPVLLQVNIMDVAALFQQNHPTGKMMKTEVVKFVSALAKLKVDKGKLKDWKHTLLEEVFILRSSTWPMCGNLI